MAPGWTSVARHRRAIEVPLSADRKQAVETRSSTVCYGDPLQGQVRVEVADGSYLHAPTRFACSLVLTSIPPLAFDFAVRRTVNESLLSVPSTRTEAYWQSEE